MLSINVSGARIWGRIIFGWHSCNASKTFWIRYPVRNLCQNVNQHTPSLVKKFLLQKSAEQNGKFIDLKSLSFIESLNFILMSEDKLLEVAIDKGLKTNIVPFCIKILNEQPKF